MADIMRVAVTGAAGQIGYSLLFRIASGEMFGKDTPVAIHLIEIEPAMQALEGVVMELEDCAFPLLKEIVYTSDLSVGFNGINWAILVGSAPRKAGMERADLLKINGKIFVEQGRALNEYANGDIQTIVVGNPCNTNSMIAMHHAADIPNNRFYAMTMLDENRAIGQLAKKANVDSTLINNMHIWGNHSATQYPDFYHATINESPVTQSIQDLNWLQTEFISNVQKRGAAIIQARGLSSAASAANAVVDSVYSVHAGEENKAFSLGVHSNGEYGAQPGLIVSYPCIMHDNQVTIVENIQHNQFSMQKIEISFAELAAERDQVKSLGVI